jgi:Flp pilus assembly pilin Flp
VVRENESGQAVVEYILLLAVVASVYILMGKALASSGLGNLLMTPITGDFARTYQYGRHDALGFDDGGPKNHPRARGGDGNFRLFINPETQ